MVDKLSTFNTILKLKLMKAVNVVDHIVCMETVATDY